MHYGVDEKLPFLTTLLYGLQWFVVTLPSAVITGVIDRKSTRLNSSHL